MAVLTKKQILENITTGRIKIHPSLDSFQLQDHAIDLRMGFTFMIPKMWKLTEKGREVLDIMHFDKQNNDFFEIVELEEGQFFDLLPGEHIIVGTLEKISLPNNLMAVLYPRSSTNRKGLSLDLTGIVDSGYEGQLTMPIRNNSKSQVVRLYPGERICQLVFETLTEETNPRKSKYHNKDVADGVKREAQKEARLILKGKIKELKTKNKIK